MRCPYCKERIRRDAVRCKHCRASIGIKNNGNGGDEELRYLQNGFSKIKQECDAVEESVNAKTGFMFIKYRYSEDELLEAASRVESFIEKIWSDLEEWKAAGKLSLRAREIFNQNVQSVYERLEEINCLIQERKPTFWEKVCFVFKRIINKLFPMLSIKLVTGSKSNRLAA